MDYPDGSIREYLGAASSGKPTPGGGSVSALVAALGTTMGSMAANFTVGRPKYAAVEPEVRRILSELERLRAELLVLVDEDVRAYGVVGRAYALPNGTSEEKKARRAEIQKVLVIALEVPLVTMRVCVGVLREMRALAEVANRNLMSDVGVGAVVTEAGLRAARLNVEVNLAGLEDERITDTIREEIDGLSTEAADLAQDVMQRVQSVIGTVGK